MALGARLSDNFDEDLLGLYRFVPTGFLGARRLIDNCKGCLRVSGTVFFQSKGSREA